MPDRAAPPEAPAPDIEITPEMIEAGLAAFYAEASSEWETPMRGELRRVLEQVYKSMAAARR